MLAVAHDHPSAPAVWGEDQAVSYAELATRVRRIAAALDVCSHPKVLVYLPQGAEAYAAMFATLMAGGYYAPVNLSAPPARQRSVIDQFAPDVVVTNAAALDKGGLDARSFAGAAMVDTRRLPPGGMDEAKASHDLAYVIFTSGSTGEPKGVMVGRDGLSRYTDWAIAAMGVTRGDKWSQYPPISFDLSVLDIYGALCAGAALYPFTSETDRMMPARAIRRHGLTIWNSVPSVVGMMMQARQVTPENLASLRLATFCGEPLSPQHLDALFAAKPDLVVHNTYGPTEATVSFTLIKLDAEDYRDHCRATVALGDAIPGMGLHLIGGATGDEGEIAITGPQLARGYWRKPQLTSQAFRPLAIDGGETPAYFTGDWAERRGDDVYFVSRMDNQVKVHGYRVELEDVNAAVRAATGRAVCSVVAKGDIHCFLEAAATDIIDEAELVARLRGALETYAIPKFFHQMDSLPRNANDKIDMKALLERVQKDAP
ncbi:MAG: AMP-binding protein [Alphaproteobacteria bacterium]|nr:AMP-binding protein [Alphaproteobacteria bacterium]